MRIFLDHDSTEYSRFLPAEWDLLGAVETDDGDRGALVRTPANVYVQVNGMLIRALDQSTVCELLECGSSQPPQSASGSASAQDIG